MRSLLIFLTVTLSAVLGGCATNDYAAYAAIHQANAAAQTARYEALTRIAEMGDTTAKVAAVMGLQANAPSGGLAVAAPVSAGQAALQWASILVPGLSQAYSVHQSTKMGMRQYDNSTALGISTNAAFVGIAGKIQAPAASVTSSTVTHADVSTTNTSTTTQTDTSTSTLAGAGVIGSGAYTVGANSGAGSGNSGRLAGAGITDATATPTVVNQPAPVIVRPEVVPQPAPIIVRPEVVPTPAPTSTQP